MGEVKQRDYVFDALRGLCMWSIPISHFTRMAGHFSQGSLSGIVYITINVFVMQAFMFLSGYFSKKPDRSRETAFKVFLWPYILSIFFFYGVRLLFWGNANLYFDRAPFAMWFMVTLFLYKVFQKNYIKIPYFFAMTFVLYLIAGCLPFLTDYLSLGRIVSYFPFFFLGYYCTPEHIAKIKCLKKWQCAVLGVFLIGVSCLLAFGMPQVPVGWYLMKDPGSFTGVCWWLDILMRAVLFIIGALWIILMFNILPSKDTYLAYVGRNTMPVYILHLVVRQWMKKHGGISLGIFPMPEASSLLYYVMVFGFASLCVVVFASKPVSKGYDCVVDTTYAIFMWVVNHIILPPFAFLEKGLKSWGISTAEWIEKQKK